MPMHRTWAYGLKKMIQIPDAFQDSGCVDSCKLLYRSQDSAAAFWPSRSPRASLSTAMK